MFKNKEIGEVMNEEVSVFNVWCDLERLYMNINKLRNKLKWSNLIGLVIGVRYVGFFGWFSRYVMYCELVFFMMLFVF